MKRKTHCFNFNLLLAFVLFLFVMTRDVSAEDPGYKLLDRLDEEDAQALIKPVSRYRPEFKGGGRDPFAPLLDRSAVAAKQMPQVLQQNLPSLTVKGIIWGSSTPQAIVNDTVVSVGDVISGATIEGIAKSGVTVSFQGVEYEISSPAEGGQLQQAPQGGAPGAGDYNLQDVIKDRFNKGYPNF